MASRGVTATPRGTPSGRPFHARFVNVASSAGLGAPVVYGSISHTDYIVESMGCGAAFIDYDNDGFDDVFITCWGQNILFRNNGNGTFTDVTEKAGLTRPGPHYATGCTWLDYDRDGRLDLFVTHYNVFDQDKIPPRGKDPDCNYNGVPIFCGPGGLPQDSCRLYHGNPDGTFTDVSAKSGIAAVKPGYALTAVATDFDGDGWPDIYVACDTSPSLFFRNNHDATFTEEGLERGVSLSEDGQEQAGMGLGIGDFNGDGFVDIFKTHFRGDTAVLYRNNGKGYFRDVTLRAGLGVETRFVCWGAAITDLDNDGLPDIFFTTGMVYPEAEERIPDAPYKTPDVVFRNLGGERFEELMTEAGPGIAETHSSRGVAFGDFDNDGDVDILIVNVNEPPSLLRNDVSGADHWLKVLLSGTASNRSAIGAQVVVTYGERKQAQAVLAQSSYLSVNDRRLHFGLGSAATASVEVRWPNGGHETIAEVAADQLVVIKEGSGVVRTERFGRGGGRRG